MNVHGDDASESDTAVVLLCVDGQVNGVQLRFLVDSGVRQCFH